MIPKFSSTSVVTAPSSTSGVKTSPGVTVGPPTSSEEAGENVLDNSTGSSAQEAASEAATTVTTPSNVETFICPANYSYIAYEDARNFQGMICGNYTGSAPLRVEEGGSVSCGDDSTLLQNDPRQLESAVCVKTTYSDPQKVSHTNLDCPLGLARASLEEAKIYIRQLCPKLGKWDILRVGVQGAFYGPGYGCKLYDWYLGNVTDVLCIKETDS